MANARSYSSYVKPLLFVILLVCLCLAGLVLVSSYSELDVKSLLKSPLLLPAIFLQIFASLLFVAAWKMLLSSQNKTTFTFFQCTAHIGITLLGKYLPGKIWGLLGRTYLLNRQGLTKSEALSLLIADQFITFFTGIMIGGVALSAYFGTRLAVLGVIVMLVLIPVVGGYYSSIISWMLDRFKLWLEKRFDSTSLKAILTAPLFLSWFLPLPRARLQLNWLFRLVAQLP